MKAACHVSLQADEAAAAVSSLEREVEQLRMEREILKKGIAIFAVPSR